MNKFAEVTPGMETTITFDNENSLKFQSKDGKSFLQLGEWTGIEIKNSPYNPMILSSGTNLIMENYSPYDEDNINILLKTNGIIQL